MCKTTQIVINICRQQCSTMVFWVAFRTTHNWRTYKSLWRFKLAPQLETHYIKGIVPNTTNQTYIITKNITCFVRRQLPSTTWHALALPIQRDSSDSHSEPRAFWGVSTVRRCVLGTAKKKISRLSSWEELEIKSVLTQKTGCFGYLSLG